MFPLVPYYNLPALHAIIKDDCPPPYGSILQAYREIIPAVLRQRKDPAYHVRRKLPAPGGCRRRRRRRLELPAVRDRPAADGWIDVAAAESIEKESVLRFDHDGRTFAVYRTADGSFHASDGLCTHGNAHLADGLVIGNQIECPKHNGRFDVRDGSPQRPPACVALQTYPVRVERGRLLLNLTATGSAAAAANRVDASAGNGLPIPRGQQRERGHLPQGAGPGTRGPLAGCSTTSRANICSLRSRLTTRLPSARFAWRPPFAEVWTAQGVFDFKAANPAAMRRNYSMASNPQVEGTLRFNVRIFLPPRGQDCNAGVGSSYVFSLKPGDQVRAFGPYGDFCVKPGDREMLYVGGGAGMAPLRAHLSLPAGDAEDHAEDRLLVRGPLAARHLLPGLFSGPGRRPRELPLPRRPLGAPAGRRLDVAHRPDPRSGAARGTSPRRAGPRSGITISAGRRPWSRPPGPCSKRPEWPPNRSPSTNIRWSCVILGGSCRERPPWRSVWKLFVVIMERHDPQVDTPVPYSRDKRHTGLSHR